MPQSKVLLHLKQHKELEAVQIAIGGGGGQAYFEAD